MNLVDVHAHLDIFEEKEMSLAIARAAQKGVKTIINNSVNPKTNRKSLQLQKEFKIVKAGLGLYPLEAIKMTESEIDEELEFMKNSNFVAVGEIGLDYQETEDRVKQQKVFEQQLELAKKLAKPVIVHSRKAEKEVVETLISSECKKVVLHAFHGSMKLVKTAIDSGFHFSIPSNVLRSQHFQKLVEAADTSNLLTETDAPFLGPYEDGKSEPAYVELSVKKIAEIKKIDVEETAGQLYRNYQQLFGIK